MKTIISSWMPVCYKGNGVGKFAYWSNLIEGKGDTTLPPSRSRMLGAINWLRKCFFWRKRVLIDFAVKSHLTTFHVGFCTKDFSVCRISSRIHKSSDGPFAMRMGPESCYFFVLADGPIEIKVIGYARGDIKLY